MQFDAAGQAQARLRARVDIGRSADPHRQDGRAGLAGEQCDAALALVRHLSRRREDPLREDADRGAGVERFERGLDGCDAGPACGPVADRPCAHRPEVVVQDRKVVEDFRHQERQPHREDTELDEGGVQPRGVVRGDDDAARGTMEASSRHTHPPQDARDRDDDERLREEEQAA